MSLSSDVNQELPSRASAIQDCSESNYVGIMQSSISTLELPTQSHSRKSSNTSWMTEVGGEEDDIQETQQNEMADEGGSMQQESIEWSGQDDENSKSKSTQEQNDTTEIIRASLGVPRCLMCIILRN